MAGQLIPPRELAPHVPAGLAPHQYISMWADLYDTCEQFLLAGLRAEVGSGGDVWAAYQRWYDAKMQEHDRTMRHMLEELTRREQSCQHKP